MKKLLSEKLELPRWVPVAWVLITAALAITIAMLRSSILHPPSSPEPEPQLNVPGYAIANFGAVPLNHDWLIIGHKSGQQIDRIPDPEQTVATSANEPIIEKVEPATAWDRPVWKITFRN